MRQCGRQAMRRLRLAGMSLTARSAPHVSPSRVVDMNTAPTPPRPGSPISSMLWTIAPTP
jgi:hypothetical protein